MKKENKSPRIFTDILANILDVVFMAVYGLEKTQTFQTSTVLEKMLLKHSKNLQFQIFDGLVDVLQTNTIGKMELVQKKLAKE